MMIAHVIGQMVPGGNERLCLELIRRAPEGAKHLLVTIGPTPDGALSELFRAVPGLEFLHVPYSPRARLGFVLALGRHFRRLQPRGIICYPFGLHLLVALAARASVRCRFISHVGNPPPADGRRRGLYRAMVLASHGLRTPLWSCSETVHHQLAQLGVGMPAHSAGVPNGVNIEALRSAAAAGRAQRTSGGPVIAMVARLDTIKDQATLLEAFATVVAQVPDAELWLVGDGDQRDGLERWTKGRGLMGSVRFLGPRKDVGELLGQASIFAFSTTAAEGFGIALAEAMAVGLPVVASNVEACREVLDGGACGLLVPPRDANSMAKAILDLLGNPDRAQALGEAAAARAEREYDIRVCAKRFYDYLLG